MSDLLPYPGERWRWPIDCERCAVPIGPWNPDVIGSPMTHIRPGGGPDWDANRDHEPEYQAAEMGA